MSMDQLCRTGISKDMAMDSGVVREKTEERDCSRGETGLACRSKSVQSQEYMLKREAKLVLSGDMVVVWHRGRTGSLQAEKQMFPEEGKTLRRSMSSPGAEEQDREFGDEVTCQRRLVHSRLPRLHGWDGVVLNPAW